MCCPNCCNKPQPVQTFNIYENDVDEARKQLELQAEQEAERVKWYRRFRP